MAQKTEAPRLVESIQNKPPYSLLARGQNKPPYSLLARGTEALHNNCPPITELEIHGQKFEVPNDKLHGFTTSWPVWYEPPLPSTVKEFLKEGVTDWSLDIFTNVFSVPIEVINQHYFQGDTAYFKRVFRSRTRKNRRIKRRWQKAYPGETRESILKKMRNGEITFNQTIGYNQVHNLTISTPTRELEVEIQRRFLKGDEFYDLFNSCFSLAVRFFTIGEDGKIVRHTEPPSDSAEFLKWVRRHDDPRNFYLEDEVPSQEQMSFVTEVLQFALTERERQLSSLANE